MVPPEKSEKTSGSTLVVARRILEHTLEAYVTYNTSDQDSFDVARSNIELRVSFPDEDSRQVIPQNLLAFIAGAYPERSVHLTTLGAAIRRRIHAGNPETIESQYAVRFTVEQDERISPAEFQFKSIIITPGEEELARENTVAITFLDTILQQDPVSKMVPVTEPYSHQGVIPIRHLLGVFPSFEYPPPTPCGLDVIRAVSQVIMHEGKPNLTKEFTRRPSRIEPS